MITLQSSYFLSLLRLRFRPVEAGVQFKLLLSIVIALGFQPLKCNAESFESFPYGQHGKVEADIPLFAFPGPNGDSIPIKLEFGTGEKYSNLLPGSWSIDFFDSHAVMTGPDRFNFLHPGGEGYSEMRLRRDGQYESSDGWVGEVRDEILTLRRGNEELEFRGGKIRWWKGSESSVEWIYADGAVASVLAGGREIFSIARRSEGVVKRYIFTGDIEGQIEYIESDLIDVEGRPEVGNVTKIVFPESIGHFDYTKEGGDTRLQISGSLFDDVVDIRWDETGTLAYLNGTNFDFLYPVKNIESPGVEIFGDGFRTRISNPMDFDGKTMIKTEYFEDGRIEKTQYVKTEAGGQIRKITEIGVNGDELETYVASYDEDGKLLRDRRGDYESRRNGDKIDVYLNGKKIYSY